jgi:hypothetical protein
MEKRGPAGNLTRRDIPKKRKGVFFMTVAELFRSVSWPSVKDAFARLYPPDEDLDLTKCKLCPELEDVFTEVREKYYAPDKSGMTVHVRFIPASEFTDEYYDVSGRLPGDNAFYGLDFSSFSQWPRKR